MGGGCRILLGGEATASSAEKNCPHGTGNRSMAQQPNTFGMRVILICYTVRFTVLTRMSTGLAMVLGGIVYKLCALKAGVNSSPSVAKGRVETHQNS